MCRWIISCCLDCLTRFDLFLITLLVIFSRPWTSHTGVLKMPRVSNEYGVLDLNANENHSDTSSWLLAFIQILDSSHCKFWHLAKFRLAGRTGDFLKFLLKANYYPVYYIMADWSDWTVLSNGEIHIKTFYDVAIFIICCAREVRASIVLNIEWVQFVL